MDIIIFIIVVIASISCGFYFGQSLGYSNAVQSISNEALESGIIHKVESKDSLNLFKITTHVGPNATKQQVTDSILNLEKSLISIIETGKPSKDSIVSED